MNPLEIAEIGRTGLRVTRLGFGGAAIGGVFAEIPEKAAIDAVRKAFQLGVRYFDTAPRYGHGKSETYLGRALSNVPRHDLLISTKVGLLLRPEPPVEGTELASG